MTRTNLAIAASVCVFAPPLSAATIVSNKSVFEQAVLSAGGTLQTEEFSYSVGRNVQSHTTPSRVKITHLGGQQTGADGNVSSGKFFTSVSNDGVFGAAAIRMEFPSAVYGVSFQFGDMFHPGPGIDVHFGGLNRNRTSVPCLSDASEQCDRPDRDYAFTFSEPLDSSTLDDNFTGRYTEGTPPDHSVTPGSDESLVWDDDAFVVSWNGDDTEVPFVFVEEPSDPSGGSTASGSKFSVNAEGSQVPEYHVAFADAVSDITPYYEVADLYFENNRVNGDPAGQFDYAANVVYITASDAYVTDNGDYLELPDTWPDLPGQGRADFPSIVEYQLFSLDSMTFALASDEPVTLPGSDPAPVPVPAAFLLMLSSLWMLTAVRRS